MLDVLPLNALGRTFYYLMSWNTHLRCGYKETPPHYKNIISPETTRHLCAGP